jgi:hypothetical protein
METLFRKLDLSSFQGKFASEEECLGFLAEAKWKDGFVCRKCGHTHYCSGKSPHSRRCTRCKAEESATAHTIFHRCKIHLPDAFRITFQVCQDDSVSSHELARTLDLRQMTCWKFKKKLTECMERRKDLISPGEIRLIE